MTHSLSGNSIAFLIANGFEETQMTEPQRFLIKAGAQVKLISPDHKLVNGWHGQTWGHFFAVDLQIGSVLGSDFDMLVIPGGKGMLRTLPSNLHTRRIIGHFLDAGKPIAAIGEGVELLTITPNLRGLKLTGLVASKTLIESAGGEWHDSGVVTDDVLVTAQGTAYLALFIETMMDKFHTVSALRQAA